MKEHNRPNREITENAIPFVELFRDGDKLTQFPSIPENPKVGCWYRIPLKEYVCGNGAPYYVSIKIGTENNLIVNFHGGGVSWNEYTAARPIAANNPCKEGFYFNNVEPFSDEAVNHGLGSLAEQNPFRNWSFVCINYSSGDFHVGQTDYLYTALDGSERKLHHHGYKNFRAAMEAVRRYITSPQKLLIAGESGGGFGAAALAGDVMEQFPDCREVTCCVDSSMLLSDDWKKIAVTVWCAPEKITRNLQGRDFTLDCLKALHKKYGEQIRYLYVSSVRDGELARFQNFMDGKEMLYSKEIGEKYNKNLTEMCAELQKEIPQCGLFLFDHLPFPNVSPELGLTQHTILLSDFVWKKNVEGKSVAEWLMNAVNGRVEKIGYEEKDM